MAAFSDAPNRISTSLALVSNENDTRSHRPIRSYVIRSGRLTDSQRKALDLYWEDFVIPYSKQPLQLQTLFPTAGKLVVEIGFGMGGSLLEMAQQDPASNFIGIEVHRPGVGKLLQGIADQQLSNLKIICHDANEVLQNCFSPESIDKVLLFFPDPWPKKRHHKRRIVQPDFIAMIRSRLRSGGQMHLATDWEEYAEYMMEVMQAAPGFRNVPGPGNFWAEPLRPNTKFESRGRRLGHGVWDLLFERVA